MSSRKPDHHSLWWNKECCLDHVVLIQTFCSALSHIEKETVLEPFVLKDLLPSSLGSYYRYTGSLTTPPCSKVVEWIIFSRPIYVSYKQVRNTYITKTSWVFCTISGLGTLTADSFWHAISIAQLNQLVT